LEPAPERLVASGPYAYTRNPMYLGHLIFLTGLTLTLKSWLAALITSGVAIWFHRRVLSDELKLRESLRQSGRGHETILFPGLAPWARFFRASGAAATRRQA